MPPQHSILSTLAHPHTRVVGKSQRKACTLSPEKMLVNPVSFGEQVGPGTLRLYCSCRFIGLSVFCRSRGFREDR